MLGKILITLFILLFTGNTSRAHILTISDLPQHSDYFKNYFQNFSDFFNRNFYDWSSVLKKENGDSLLPEYKHWFIAGKSPLRPNILWGIGYNIKNKRFFYTLQYARPNGNDSEIIHHRSDKKDTCKETETSMICSSQKVQPLFHSKSVGKGKLEGLPLVKKGNFYFKEFIKEQKVYGPLHQPTAVFFSLSNVQAEWLPKELKKVVYQIGFKTRLPLDKLQVSRNGDIIVYYP